MIKCNRCPFDKACERFNTCLRGFQQDTSTTRKARPFVGGMITTAPQRAFDCKYKSELPLKDENGKTVTRECPSCGGMLQTQSVYQCLFRNEAFPNGHGENGQIIAADCFKCGDYIKKEKP